MVSLLIVEALVELSILVVGEGRCSRIVFYLLQLRINLPIYAFKIGHWKKNALFDHILESF